MQIKLRNFVIVFICYLYAFLFTYAAVSKLLEFDNFQAQLGQSPLLSAFVNIVSWVVPVTEILIAIAFFIPKYRVLALYSSFSLMVMFTVYIYIILNFSNYIPCSCGGILEKLNWSEHLIFNFMFVALSVIAILLTARIETSTMRPKKTTIVLSIISIICISFIVLLNYLSEDISKNHNSFIRNFHFLAQKKYETIFPYNSYYIAGIDDGKIYLGNYTAPFQITILDTTLSAIASPKITLTPNNLVLLTGNIRIKPPYFFFIDGTNPCVFRGKLSDWKGSLKWKDSTWFSHAEIIDSANIVFRTNNANLETTIGTLNLDSGVTNFANNILTKQIDGTFDSDGTLQFDPTTNRLIYLYRYRNQYSLADRNLKVLGRGKTIDTISKAQIEVATIEDRHERKMSKPPLIVNKGNVVFKNLLFVNAGLVGRYEDEQMWKDTSIIDVYDTDTKSYISSFYIYNINGSKIRSFIVKENMLYAMIGKSLVAYRMNKYITSHYRKTQSQPTPK